jgi:hypothetical protein
MVTFTTDPRIAYARARQQAGMKQAMTPYQLPRNPYGGSPIAGNLQRLADALGARWAGGDAARLQEGQQGARSKILAELLGAETGVPGSEQYARGPMLVPTQDVQATGEYKRTPVGGDWQRVDIDDTGATVIDPAVLKTAGLSLGEYSIAKREAKLAGTERSQAERIAFATQKLGEATTQKDRKYWLAQVDALKAAVREMNVEDEEQREIRAAQLDMTWVKNNKTGKNVFVSNYNISRNPERYSEIIEVQPPQAWVGVQYLEISKEATLAQNMIDQNEIAMRIVARDGILETGSFTPIITTFKGWMQALGITVGEELSAAQVLISIGSKKALLLRNPDSGMGLTGTTSDADLNFLKAASISLSKTNDANEALLIIDTAIQRRKLRFLDIQMAWISKNQASGLIGFNAGEANKALKEESLFNDTEKARLDELMGRAEDAGALRTTPAEPYIARPLR